MKFLQHMTDDTPWGRFLYRNPDKQGEGETETQTALPEGMNQENTQKLIEALKGKGLYKGVKAKEQVKVLQEILVATGYMTQEDMNTGPGIFGFKTEKAAIQFKEALGFTGRQINSGNLGILTIVELEKRLTVPAVPEIEKAREATAREVAKGKTRIEQAVLDTEVQGDTKGVKRAAERVKESNEGLQTVEEKNAAFYDAVQRLYNGNPEDVMYRGKRLFGLLSEMASAEKNKYGVASNDEYFTKILEKYETSLNSNKGKHIRDQLEKVFAQAHGKELASNRAAESKWIVVELVLFGALKLFSLRHHLWQYLNRSGLDYNTATRFVTWAEAGAEGEFNPKSSGKSFDGLWKDDAERYKHLVDEVKSLKAKGADGAEIQMAQAQMGEVKASLEETFGAFAEQFSVDAHEHAQSDFNWFERNIYNNTGNYDDLQKDLELVKTKGAKLEDRLAAMKRVQDALRKEGSDDTREYVKEDPEDKHSRSVRTESTFYKLDNKGELARDKDGKPILSKEAMKDKMFMATVVEDTNDNPWFGDKRKKLAATYKRNEDPNKEGQWEFHVGSQYMGDVIRKKLGRKAEEVYRHRYDSEYRFIPRLTDKKLAEMQKANEELEVKERKRLENLSAYRIFGKDSVKGETVAQYFGRKGWEKYIPEETQVLLAAERQRERSRVVADVMHARSEHVADMITYLSTKPVAKKLSKVLKIAAVPDLQSLFKLFPAPDGVESIIKDWIEAGKKGDKSVLEQSLIKEYTDSIAEMLLGRGENKGEGDRYYGYYLENILKFGKGEKNLRNPDAVDDLKLRKSNSDVIHGPMLSLKKGDTEKNLTYLKDYYVHLKDQGEDAKNISARDYILRSLGGRGIFLTGEQFDQAFRSATKVKASALPEKVRNLTRYMEDNESEKALPARDTELFELKHSESVMVSGIEMTVNYKVYVRPECSNPVIVADSIEIDTSQGVPDGFPEIPKNAGYVKLPMDRVLHTDGSLDLYVPVGQGLIQRLLERSGGSTPNGDVPKDWNNAPGNLGN